MGFTKIRKTKSASAIHEPEHPTVQCARKCYGSLSKHDRKSNAFLPLASRRSESVSTHDDSEEYGRLRRGKWHLKNVAASIDNLTNSVVEKLDEDKLKLSAMEGLEGVSDRQQQIVIAEMNKVLEE